MSDELFSKVENLMALIERLSNKAFNLYLEQEKDAAFDRSTVGFEQDVYDAMAINCNSDFESFKRTRIVAIYLYKDKQVNEVLLSKLFEVRKRVLNRLINKINSDNLGTCLNILRESWNDLCIDLKRHEIKMN